VSFRNKQKESFAFWLTSQCLEADNADENEKRHLSNAEFVLALVGVTFIVVAGRCLVWLFCGC
jgi:hypothetical protein